MNRARVVAERNTKTAAVDNLYRSVQNVSINNKGTVVQLPRPSGSGFLALVALVKNTRTAAVDNLYRSNKRTEAQ